MDKKKRNGFEARNRQSRAAGIQEDDADPFKPDVAQDDYLLFWSYLPGKSIAKLTEEAVRASFARNFGDCRSMMTELGIGKSALLRKLEALGLPASKRVPRRRASCPGRTRRSVTFAPSTGMPD